MLQIADLITKLNAQGVWELIHKDTGEVLDQHKSLPNLIKSATHLIDQGVTLQAIPKKEIPLPIPQGFQALKSTSKSTQITGPEETLVQHLRDHYATIVAQMYLLYYIYFNKLDTKSVTTAQYRKMYEIMLCVLKDLMGEENNMILPSKLAGATDLAFMLKLPEKKNED